VLKEKSPKSLFFEKPIRRKVDFGHFKNVQKRLPPHRGGRNKCNGATCKLFSNHLTFKIKKKIGESDVEPSSHEIFFRNNPLMVGGAATDLS